jgi:two-component SAPR family response regulator
MKIVVVDDEMRALHVFLNEIIKRDGVEYKFFQDDEKGILDYVAQSNVDGVFLDIKMPNINGLELAKKLIAIKRGIKIVFITGLTIGLDDLDGEIRAHTLGFMYKPYDEKVLNNFLCSIENSAQVITVKTFGAFECYVGEKRIFFSSNKSRELFALLIAYAGKNISMNETISFLWPEHDYEKAKKLYRDAVWRLRKTLLETGVNCVIFGRATMTVIKSNIRCDFWEYLEKRKGNYNGEFLANYDWSVDYLAILDEIKRTTPFL